MGQSDADQKYVLVLKDDLSGYCWLEASATADSKHAAEVLSRWTRVFTSPDVWLFDQGAHFKNEVLEQLATSNNIKHNLVVAYSPWVNGKVEALMQPVLAATPSLLAELKLGPQD